MPPPLEAETNVDRYRHLLLTNDAVLYEDDLLQVGLKGEYHGHEGVLSVFFGNKGASPLQHFTTEYVVKEEHALHLTRSTLSEMIETHDQVVQRVGVACYEPFVSPPTLRVQFLTADASPRALELRFPVVLTKFCSARELTQPEFFRIWKSQGFILNEVTSVVNLAPRLKGASVQVARSLAFGDALRLHHGFDSNPDNFVLATDFRGRRTGETSVARGPSAEDDHLALVRVEVGEGRFKGKARISIRASERLLARALCECIEVQLTLPMQKLGSAAQQPGASV